MKLLTTLTLITLLFSTAFAQIQILDADSDIGEVLLEFFGDEVLDDDTTAVSAFDDVELDEDMIGILDSLLEEEEEETGEDPDAAYLQTEEEARLMDEALAREQSATAKKQTMPTNNNTNLDMDSSRDESIVRNQASSDRMDKDTSTDSETVNTGEVTLPASLPATGANI